MHYTGFPISSASSRCSFSLASRLTSVILERISETIVDTTSFMPVTREMSAAKRLILETWGGLVLAGFPQQDLPPIAVPCDLTNP
jgi:hypothetical protein